MRDQPKYVPRKTGDPSVDRELDSVMNVVNNLKTTVGVSQQRLMVSLPLLMVETSYVLGASYATLDSQLSFPYDFSGVSFVRVVASVKTGNSASELLQLYYKDDSGSFVAFGEELSISSAGIKTGAWQGIPFAGQDTEIQMYAKRTGTSTVVLRYVLLQLR